MNFFQRMKLRKKIKSINWDLLEDSTYASYRLGGEYIALDYLRSYLKGNAGEPRMYFDILLWNLAIGQSKNPTRDAAIAHTLHKNIY